jgi:hypothetical protein
MRQLLLDLVPIAFDVIGTLKEKISVTYVLGVGAYDPVSDTTSTSENPIPDIDVVFTNFTVDEMDESIVVATDMKVLIPAKYLDSVKPRETDYIIDSSLTRWNIRKVKSPPGDSLYILHVRRT